MLRHIRNLIGGITLPKETYIDSLGDFWVESHWSEVFGYYPYNYTRIKQNWYGSWIKETEYLSKHTKLKKVGE